MCVEFRKKVYNRSDDCPQTLTGRFMKKPSDFVVPGTARRLHKRFGMNTTSNLATFARWADSPWGISYAAARHFGLSEELFYAQGEDWLAEMDRAILHSDLGAVIVLCQRTLERGL